MNLNRTILIGLAIVAGAAMVLFAELGKEVEMLIIGNIFGMVGGLSVSGLEQRAKSGSMKTLGMLIGLMALSAVSVGLVGCSYTQSPTQNALNAAATQLESNTGQNTQVWPDGSMQTTSTAPESAQITGGGIDFQSTSLSALASIGSAGATLRNPGNFEAAEITLLFREPFAYDSGEVVMPLESLVIKGVKNEVTTVVDANTDQVALWVSVLGDLSEDQAAVKIEELERDRVISEATAGSIRDALGILGAVIAP